MKLLKWFNVQYIKFIRLILSRPVSAICAPSFDCLCKDIQGNRSLIYELRQHELELRGVIYDLEWRIGILEGRSPSDLLDERMTHLKTRLDELAGASNIKV